MNALELQPEEPELIGSFVDDQGVIRSDESADRIRWLTSNSLRKVAVSPTYGAWETLFVDPRDGRYWEQTFPHSEMHGGGAAQAQVSLSGRSSIKIFYF
jgi:hypothetical protein